MKVEAWLIMVTSMYGESQALTWPKERGPKTDSYTAYNDTNGRRHTGPYPSTEPDNDRTIRVPFSSHVHPG